jgi:dihydroxyacetone kinase-like predicted kinase
VVAAEVMDGAVVRRWCRLAAEALGQTRSAIDALNVYPVPDADTGTNLYRTLRSAAQAVDELPETAEHAAVWRAAADGAMLGACGNSGIIVSQLLRGLAEICAPASPCDGAVVARALEHAATLARAAVSRPAEGTVLTVADAASRAALLLAGAAAQATTGLLADGPAAGAMEGLTAGAAAGGLTAAAGPTEGLTAGAADGLPAAAGPTEGLTAGAADGLTAAAAGLTDGSAAGPELAGAGLTDGSAAGPELAGAGLAAVVLAAAGAAREALGLTTGQLAALAASGVVDAGGAGLCVVLDAWAAAIAGTPLDPLDVPRPTAAPAGPAAASGLPAESRLPAEPVHAEAHGYGAAQPDASGSYGYEVTYLLAAAADAVAGLREQLDAMGDSLVIAGGGDLWSVHVHVADAGAAIEAGLRAGQPRRITVTYLGGPPPAGHWVLAICDTPGLAALAESAGARVLRADPDAPPDAPLDPARISAAVRGPAGRCIIVPNGSRAHAAATTAAEDLRGEGIEVLVVDVRSAVQVLPALAVHEPAAEFGADAAAMDRAAARMRHAQASWAPPAEQADPAAPAAPGPAAPGPAAPEAATPTAATPAAATPAAEPPELAAVERAVLAMTDELLTGHPELMTFLVGAGAPAGLGELAVERVRAVSPQTEVECHLGAVAGAVVLAGAE